MTTSVRTTGNTRQITDELSRIEFAMGHEPPMDSVVTFTKRFGQARGGTPYTFAAHRGDKGWSITSERYTKPVTWHELLGFAVLNESGSHLPSIHVVTQTEKWV